MSDEPGPYLAALDHAFRQKSREAEDLATEVAFLRAELLKRRAQNAQLRNALADARRRLELWRIRHKTWQNERRELDRAAR
jgi:hypothetical protein